MQDDTTTVQDPNAGMLADDNNGGVNNPVPSQGPMDTPTETPVPTEEPAETPATGETPVEGNPEETPVGDNSGTAQ